ncbi:MAG: DegT/DnrJ/EryC1/StrS family aminotransferase [Armatimonadetes bacterium]|nr:DegT/DnrJ/EryC1/StrS family aminotransferase [Armatimonadota bacterium]
MGVDRFDGVELEYLKQILARGRLSGQGDGFHGKLEAAFAEAYGVKHAIAANAAMSLLISSVFAAGAGTGDEVICDPLVQFHAIGALWQNCYPTFADVCPDTWLMDPESARRTISPQTKAICVTNLWGQPAELDALRKVADERGVVLIEDCAHAQLLPYKGKFAGTWGHIGVFSFCQGKHMTTGDGGIAVTDDDELAARIRSVTCFGESPPHLATVFRMTEMQAAIGLAQLEKVKGYLEEYLKSYAQLSAAIDGCGWLQPRAIRDGCGNSPYIFSFAWRGDDHGVNLERFKQALFDTGDTWNIGFTQVPAYKYKLFTEPLAYQNKGCPIHRCPYYEGSYQYHDGLCPTAEAILPRLVNHNCMLAEEQAKGVGDRLRVAIEATERG